MLYFEIPKQPVPAAMVAAVNAAREARKGSPQEGRPAAEVAYQNAVEAVRSHVASVGVDKVEVPMEVQHGGAEAMEQFHFAQLELRRPTLEG